MKSIFFKNFIITAAMFVFCFLLFGLSLFFMARSYIVQEQRDLMTTNAEEVSRTAEAYRLSGGLRSLDLRMSISAMSRATGNHIFLCNSQGEILSCSDMEWVCPHIGKTVDSAVLLQLQQTGSYEAVTDLNGFYDNAYYVLAKPMASRDNQLIGYVFIGYDSSDLMDKWSTFMILFASTSVLILAIAVAIEWVSSNRNTKPIKEMAAAARSFSRGDYSARVIHRPGLNEISDLTDAFNSMAETMEQNEQARREFISNVSHELRTPMTSISGFADGILDGTISPADAPRYLQTISSETKRLSRLVRSMLDMSRLQEGGGTPAPYDHSEMVLQTLLNFEDRISKKDLDVCLNMPDEHLFALGHLDSLTRVVYNLLDNAVKFSSPGTALTISLWRDSGKIYTRIADIGQTIPTDELPLIFDRFHKSDASRGLDRDGAGLGLYMVKAILDSHRQDIYVTSENGETAFIFTLNETAAPSAAAHNKGGSENAL